MVWLSSSRMRNRPAIVCENSRAPIVGLKSSVIDDDVTNTHSWTHSFALQREERLKLLELGKFLQLQRLTPTGSTWL